MRRKVMSILLCFMMVMSVLGAMVQIAQEPDSNNIIITEDSIIPYGKDGYELANEDSKLKIYFDENSVGDGVKVSVGNHWVVWKWKEMSYLSDNDGIETISTVSDVEGTIENNIVTYDGTYPFSEEIFTVSSNRLKHDIILSQLPYPPTNMENIDHLSYIGIIDFSSGLSMYVDGIEQEGDFITSSEIVFVDENGIELFSMAEPYAYEKNNEKERIDCQYGVKHVNDEILFYISTPYNWLSDSRRNFPVVIDPTVVSGYLYSDTIWTLANSPYIVTDDITVVPGVTLTIEPGVVVKFDGPYELVIDGNLVAQGTDTNNIVFTSNSTTPSVGDWLGIKFRDTSPDYGSVLDWVTVMYSEMGISFEHTSQSMYHMNITNNEYGVYIYEEYTFLSCSIDNSDIYDNDYGIYISKYHISITVSDSNIFDNEYGIDSNAFDSLSITNSKFYNNTYGIYSRESITVSNSEIYQNSFGLYVQHLYTTISNCDIHDNEYGVYFHDASGTLGYASVYDSDVYNNDYGIYSYGDQGLLKVLSSSINNNLYLGISSLGPITITQSSIVNNGGNGLEAKAGGTIHNSNIYGNSLYDVNVTSFYDIDATHNWWGTTDPVQIESKVYDYYDDYYLGKLNYNPLLDGPGGSPIDIGIRPTPYISVDTTWTLSGSPYILTSNVVIEVGIKLTIEPGVVVKFDGPYELVVDGYLKSQGTDTSNIVFTSNSTTPSVRDWLGIKFRDTSPDYGSVLDWVTVMYSEKGISFEHSSQSMSHMNITNNEYGVYIYEEYTFLSCSIDNSDIYDNDYGIYISKYHISITVSDSNIFDNEYGIDSSAFDSFTITNSKFYNNTYGIYSREPTTVSNSEIYQNGYGAYVQDSSTFSNCDIHDNDYGVYVDGGYHVSASISYSDIYDNGYGISILGEIGSLTVSGSGINNNLYLGISSQIPITITGSSIVNNGGNGIEAKKGGTIHYSNIYGNSPYDVKIMSPFNINVDATHNWWGTTDPIQIESKIYDYYDDYYLGKLNYNPLLNGPGGSPLNIGKRPSSYVSSDTTWTMAGSPYILTDNVVIEVGVTLTIEPGVVVKFDGPYELVVDGYLNAQGTDTNNIVFTSNSTTPSVGDWLEIRFRDTNPDYGSVLDWVTIMYSEKGISFEHTSQSMSHMNITKNEYGVFIYTEWGSLSCSISNSDIYNNTYGIYAHDYHITITVSGCNIFENEYGIDSSAFDSLSITNSKLYNNTYGIFSREINTVSNSEIYQNGYGIYIHNSHTTLSNCDIHDNDYGVYVDGGNRARASISYSDIYNNGYGIYGFDYRGSLAISGSSINNNLYLGISSPGPLTITQSRIVNNGGNGIEICKESTIHYSDIYGNSPYDVIIVNTFYFIVDATNNWWGTTNDSLIEQNIYDYNDDYNLSIVFLWPKSNVPFSPNSPPVANIVGPCVGEENSPISFDASGSYDIDNNILQYRWDFNNDGIWDTGYSIEPITSYTWGDDYFGIVVVEVYDGEFTDTATSNVTVYNIVPSPNIVGPNEIDENSPLNLECYVIDPGSDDLTFTWEFEFGSTITNIYYNDGKGPDSHPSPEIKPMNISDYANYIYGDNGVFAITLTVEDDDGGITIITFNVTVTNVLPEVNPGGLYTTEENLPIILTVNAFDTGSDDLTITWDWGDGFSESITTTYYNNNSGPDPFPSVEVNPISITESQTHIYGDNGVFNVTLTVEDDDGGITIETVEVIVNNIAPIILNVEAYMNLNFSLRVAGEKWHSVNITLFEDTVEIWNDQVTRAPGSPDAQATILSGYDINLGSTYNAIVDYIPNDPRINGNVWGGNPVWIDLEFQDGTTARLHHTFNVRQSDWDSDHWNHIDPWEVNLTGIIYKHNITFEAIASDPGSDDLTFVWDFGDGGNTTANTYFNKGISSDPYPSPEINPINVSDMVMHAYASSGIYTVTLTVMDDDGGIATITIIIVIPG